MTKAIALVAHAVGLNLNNHRAYDLHIPDDITFEVKEYLSGWDDKIKIVINAFTGSQRETYLKSNLLDLLRCLINPHPI